MASKWAAVLRVLRPADQPPDQKTWAYDVRALLKHIAILEDRVKAAEARAARMERVVEAVRAWAKAPHDSTEEAAAEGWLMEMLTALGNHEPEP